MTVGGTLMTIRTTSRFKTRFAFEP